MRPVPGNRIIARRGVIDTALDAEDVCLIEFRDTFGDIVAIVSGLCMPGSMLFASPGDDEWQLVLESNGYRQDSVNIGPGKPGRVRAFNRKADCVMDDHSVTVIEFREDNRIVAVIFRQFSDDMWLLADEDESDWEHYLARLGYIPAGSVG